MNSVANSITASASVYGYVTFLRCNASTVKPQVVLELDWMLRLYEAGDSPWASELAGILIMDLDLCLPFAQGVPRAFICICQSLLLEQVTQDLGLHRHLIVAQ